MTAQIGLALTVMMVLALGSVIEDSLHSCLVYGYMDPNQRCPPCPNTGIQGFSGCTLKVPEQIAMRSQRRFWQNRSSKCSE